MTASSTQTLEVRTSPRALASLLLAGGVAAAMLGAEQLLDGWSDRHLVGGWLAMWAVGVVAIMVLRGLTRRAAQFIMSTLDTWSADVARRRADERLWAMAQSDARLMADLQSAFTRSEAPHELKDIFALAQRRADHIAQQHLYHI